MRTCFGTVTRCAGAVVFGVFGAVVVVVSGDVAVPDLLADDAGGRDVADSECRAGAELHPAATRSKKPTQIRRPTRQPDNILAARRSMRERYVDVGAFAGFPCAVRINGHRPST